MAKNFEVWVKDGGHFLHIDEEAKYMEYVNSLMRNNDLIEDSLIVHFHLRDLIGGKLNRTQAVYQLRKHIRDV